MSAKEPRAKEPSAKDPGGPGPALELLAVDLGPDVLAGFTTRSGGVSTGVFATLNLGLTVGDEPAHVLANRELLARRAGGPVAFANQVHGARVLAVTSSSGLSVALGPADALVTASSIPVGVLVADCVPVLLADPDARVVATAHAGRAGVRLGVVAAVVDAMVASGADPGHVRAAIGPSICGRCYEVGAATCEEVAALVPATRSLTSWGTPSLDLRAGVLAQLREAGVTQVHEIDACTMTDERFFSHRRAARSGVPTGRLAGVVRLLPPSVP